MADTSQEKLVRIISHRLKSLGDLVEHIDLAHDSINRLFQSAKPDLKDGKLTPEVCLAMAELLAQQEANVQSLLRGYYVTHDNMSLARPKGINEGQKDCEPWC